MSTSAGRFAPLVLAAFLAGAAVGADDVDAIDVSDDMRRAAEAVAERSLERERSSVAVPPAGEKTGETQKGGVAERVDLKHGTEAPPPGAGESDRATTGVTVNVPLDETTRLKGGVEVERDRGTLRDDADTTPQVGVEKRF